MLQNNPDILYELQFERIDKSASASRVVHFTKQLFTIGETEFNLVLEYDLDIDDEPYFDNRSTNSWTLNETYLEVIGHSEYENRTVISHRENIKLNINDYESLLKKLAAGQGISYFMNLL